MIYLVWYFTYLLNSNLKYVYKTTVDKITYDNPTFDRRTVLLKVFERQ